MKFLIVGASGFIGRNVLAYVQGRGFVAVGTQARSRHKELVTFDLQSGSIAECLGRSFFSDGDVVTVICAVISDMDLCRTDREMARQVNVIRTIQLANDVHQFGSKIIFLSSCFVFDGGVGYYKEADAPSPANEYGRHKSEVEQYLLQNIPRAFIARLDKVVGDDPSDRQLFSDWYQRIQANTPIVCIEGSLLSPTYVSDVAQSIVLAAQLDLQGVYHVSNSEYYFRHELALEFCRGMGCDHPVRTQPLSEFGFADNRALRSCLDGSRFAAATGLAFTPMQAVIQRFRERVQDGWGG